jgi:hypothetical protein
LILSWVAEGYAAAGEAPAAAEAPAILDLVSGRDGEAAIAAAADAFLAADEVVVALPLYTDQAPGVVMRLFDLLGAAAAGGPAAGRLAGKRVGFIIHCGFPEACQLDGLRDYLARLSDRLGFAGLGVAVKAGSEGFRMTGEPILRKIRADFVALGAAAGSGGVFPPEVLARLEGLRRFGFVGRVLLRLMAASGAGNFYWNMMLRKHGAWEKRFDAPYA